MAADERGPTGRMSLVKLLTPMSLTTAAGTPNTIRSRFAKKVRGRRGVAAVLAMMFLILFGSLAAAMAIASKGNIATAATHIHVLRAQGAAETGLQVAKSRLAEAAARFLVSESNVNATFGSNLWNGNLGSIGTYTILPPATGRLDGAAPTGLGNAVAQLHAMDQGTISSLGVSAPTMANAPTGASSEYAASNWLYTPAVSLETAQVGDPHPPLAYSITYAPLANGTDIRAIVTGIDHGYTKNGQPVRRTVMQDFRMVKRVNHAIISPNRVMIGKNVMVYGSMGSRFTGVTNNNGDPIVTRSDFWGLDNVLNQKLTAFYAGLSADVDGDNRLRVRHPTESTGIPSGTTDYDGDGIPDDAFADVTGDGYVDEFDVFIKHYDRNGDGKLNLSASLTDGTPAQGSTPEFTADNELAILIDSSTPDRNRNGVFGFTDTNGNGYWNIGEPMADVDPSSGVKRDQILGYRDGVIDKKDLYAKVSGRLSFKVSKNAWQTAQGDVAAKLRGPIKPDRGQSATRYGVSDNELPAVDMNSFSTSQSALQTAADGQSFAQQVATQLGVSVAQLATYVETNPAGGSSPRYLRVDPDANMDGLPDNSATAYFEKVPFNSPSFSDVYFRPVYENMVFKDVKIPTGTNALFRNCTFVGVTHVRSTTGNDHVLWNEYGKMTLDGTGRPVPTQVRIIYGDQAGETSYPTSLPATACPPDQMILMANPPLDKADLTAAQAAVTTGFNLLPNPLIIGGRRVTDTKTVSNNIRFHDCIVVGSIVTDAPGNYTQVRNKLQFTGATKFFDKHPTQPDNSSLNPESSDRAEIAKSSLMAPNYSIDIGSFNSPTSQDVRLKGAVIAGVLDARGNTSIDGALLLTFNPVLGQGPLRDAAGNPIGNPAGFNTTLGYFGPADGDAESLDPTTLPIVGGVRIVGYDIDGDGLADTDPGAAQPPGSTPVPFHGYGRITLRFDPNMSMPSGVMLPMQMIALPTTYREGQP